MKLEHGEEIIGFLSGKMKLYNVNVMVGDWVDVVVDPYGGKTSNRIIHRDKVK